MNVLDYESVLLLWYRIHRRIHCAKVNKAVLGVVESTTTSA